MKPIAIFILCILFCLSVLSQVPVAVETVIHLKTIVTEDPPSISFSWNEIQGNHSVYIFRKSVNAITWEKIESIPPHINTYSDLNVQIGRKYEYRIVSSNNGFVSPEIYVSAGIKYRETEYRGKIILLVDSIFTDPLQNELSMLETDLIGDGWEIIRRDISRNSSVKEVKDLIREIYFSDFKNVNTLFLVGHIPVPYSGNVAFDGHEGTHSGAWPADIYYGDMNESFWTDSEVYDTLAIHPGNHNVPGDGKFDLSVLEPNQTVLLKIGRVDFNNLPAFSLSEIELMRNYMDKDHSYRHKMIKPEMQALVDDNLGTLPIKTPGGDTASYEIMSLSGWRNFTALFNFDNVKAGKFFNDALNDSYIWTYGCGWGTDTSCLNLGTVTDFVNYTPQTVFTSFYGSWFGDWNTQNNFLRSALASNGWILTSCWAGRPHYIFHHMGMGETIGSCIQRTQNNNGAYYAANYSRAINISLMGDPTLRMHVVSPIGSLNSEITENNAIDLNWDPPEDEIIGYYVYKLDMVSNKYERMNKEIINDTYYSDVSPETGNNYYMVRSLQLTESASGSYYNLSQGVFDTIQFLQTHISEIDMNNENEFIVYPNPAINYITIKTSNISNYNISITTVNGRLLFNQEMEGKTHQLDLSSYKSGIYFITIRSKDLLVRRKIVKL